MYSNDFTPYYDALMGDYSSIQSLTKKLINKYLPEGSSILELGCGTGNILQSLGNKYKLFGLDNSMGMLKIAKKKLPNATFYHQDMTKMKVDAKFDGIICIFDSINHLTTFSQWKQVFSKARKNLHPHGVFIFDMNTTRRLDTLCTFPLQIEKLDRDTFATIKINHSRKHLYNITFQIFSNTNSNKIEYLEEKVFESAFELTTVRDTLLRLFSIEQTVDPMRQELSEETGRIFFVCKPLPQLTS